MPRESITGMMIADEPPPDMALSAVAMSDATKIMTSDDTKELYQIPDCDFGTKLEHVRCSSHYAVRSHSV